MKEKLEQAVSDAIKAVGVAKTELEAFNALPENNVYEDMEKAGWDIEEKLLTIARGHCEGSYNFGDEVYTQGFLVGAIQYTAKLTCEYNRHDKQYYFVECSEFEIEETK